MTNNDSTARPAFRVLGTTDDVTTCELCGRDELKGTIRLGVLDADGNVEGTVYYGASCGAKAAGWTTKDVRKAATAADRAAAEAARAERAAKAEADYQASVLLRYTADCPLMPTICSGERRGCPVHGDAPRKVYVIITISSDYRIHAHGGYFVDVRDGSRDGSQMTARNPGTHAEALAFVDQLRDGAALSGKAIQFIVDDQAGWWEARQR